MHSKSPLAIKTLLLLLLLLHENLLYIMVDSEGIAI